MNAPGATEEVDFKSFSGYLGAGARVRGAGSRFRCIIVMPQRLTASRICR